MHRATIFIAVLALAVPCLAQDSSTGAIPGTVFDPSIRRIAGASVALVNAATGLHYERLTKSQGQFVFKLLSPCEYTARVTSEGMSPQLNQSLHVDISGISKIVFQMATVMGDVNQDSNRSNDCLPGERRNSFTGPTTRASTCSYHTSFTLRTPGAQNSPPSPSTLFNRLNRRFHITDERLMSSAAAIQVRH